MICQRMGLPPTSTSGLGRTSVYSAKRVPMPPQRITTGIEFWGFVEFIGFIEFTISFMGVSRERGAKSKAIYSQASILIISGEMSFFS